MARRASVGQSPTFPWVVHAWLSHNMGDRPWLISCLKGIWVTPMALRETKTKRRKERQAFSRDWMVRVCGEKNPRLTDHQCTWHSLSLLVSVLVSVWIRVEHGDSMWTLYAHDPRILEIIWTIFSLTCVKKEKIRGSTQALDTPWAILISCACACVDWDWA